MFYDVYCKLCEKNGISPTRAALEIGLSRATPTTWKKTGNTPQAAQLQKIAEYFGVSVDYLLGNEPPKDVDVSVCAPISATDNLGNRLKAAREKASLSQEQLAEKLHISLENVQQYEQNQAFPSFEKIEEMGKIFHVNFLDLLGITDMNISHAFDILIDCVKNIDGFAEFLMPVLKSYFNLNANGQQRALENLQDIAEIPKYQKKQDETENKDGAGTE